MIARISITLMLLVLVNASAKATPNCLRDISAVQARRRHRRMVNDHCAWRKLHPGTAPVDDANLANLQRVGRGKTSERGLVLVGPGFRYFAKPDFAGTDSFTLIVVGKNRHDEGSSRVQIDISGQTMQLASRQSSSPKQ